MTTMPRRELVRMHTRRSVKITSSTHFATIESTPFFLSVERVQVFLWDEVRQELRELPASHRGPYHV